MKSIWSDSVQLRGHESLKSDIKADVLIIGGGMAGILCAFHLKQNGVHAVITEGGRIGSGITKNTTAKITSQHGLFYHQMIKRVGFEKAKLYLSANEHAVAQLRTLCEGIDCDYQTMAAHVFSKIDQKSIENELESVCKLGFPAQYIRNLPLPFDTAGAIRFANQAQFHPLKFITEISKDLSIYENTFVQSIDPRGGVARTDRAKVHADHIIVATHFPFLNTRGGYFLKMYQHRSYVIALENAANVDGMYLEETVDGLSFRNHRSLLFIGGGDHRTGKRGGNWAVLRALAKTAYPGAVETHRWATQDCMTLDGVPYIGRYANNTPNLYVATGFNKWGMSSSMVAANLITDIIMGRKNEAADVFSPARSMLWGKLVVNGFTSLGDYLHAGKRCPHLGCALSWNPVESTWDCPCHGSRFSETGDLIDNPATRDIKHK